MLYLTAFFYFLSGNNNMPEQNIVMGPDGEFKPRITELDVITGIHDEYSGFLNGTGNWTEVGLPLEDWSSTGLIFVHHRMPRPVY
jgi:hypothetical protein